MALALAVCAAGGLAQVLAPKLWFSLDGVPTPLELIDGVFGVQHPPDRAEALRAEILAEVPDWEVAGTSGTWTLFALPSASSEHALGGREPAAGAGPLPDLLSLLEDLAAKFLGDGEVISPLLRDADGFERLIGSRVMVRFEEKTPEAAALAVLENAGGVVVQERLGFLDRAYLVSFPKARSALEVLELANELAELPEVDWSQPDFATFGASPGGDCVPLAQQPSQGELDQNWWDDGTWGINISGAWGICGGADASGQPLVTVGLIGDGLDLGHPDLYDPSPPIDGMDFLSDPAGQGSGGAHFDQCEGHETLVAGMLAMAANGSGGVGSAPRVRIVSARAHWIKFDTSVMPNQCRTQVAVSSDVCNAIGWITSAAPTGAGARVVNYSWVMAQDVCIVNGVAEAVTDRDVMMFFSVGNQDDNEIGFPSVLPESIAVGAIDATGQRWRVSSSLGSNFGTGLRYVAPGNEIFTTDRQGSAGFDTGNWISGVRGTSFATPLVAGTAALIRALRPDLSVADVDSILCSTAVAVPDWDRADDADFEPAPECGLIDATAALTWALSYPPIFTDDFETGDINRWTGSAPP